MMSAHQKDTIIAVFESRENAQAAIAELRTAGLGANAIHQSEKPATAVAGAMAQPRKEESIWSTLFGTGDDVDRAVLDRSLASGSTVVTVEVTDAEAHKVTDILERHHPLDVDERASTSATTTRSATLPSAGAAALARSTRSEGAAIRTGSGTTDETIRLAEESIAVGKRAVNRGTTRVRRYVVETPVEENVTLRTETVTLERRPVTDGSTVTDADFTEKTIEMTETSEEAVVSKTARVVEEVQLRKTSTDRVETVKDTVRRDAVEVEEGAATGVMAEAATAPPPRRSA